MSKMKDILEQERTYSDKYLFTSEIKRKQNRKDLQLAFLLIATFVVASVVSNLI